MHTQHINTAASESSKTWVNGQTQTAEGLVFVRVDTGRVFSEAIALKDGSIVSVFSFETLEELQVQYTDMALMTEDKADALFCTRLFRPGKKSARHAGWISCTRCRRWTGAQRPQARRSNPARCIRVR